MGPYHIARVVCPFGVMNFTTMDRRVFKRDFCGGDPQSVRFCEVKAVEYVGKEGIWPRLRGFDEGREEASWGG